MTVITIGSGPDTVSLELLVPAKNTKGIAFMPENHLRKSRRVRLYNFILMGFLSGTLVVKEPFGRYSRKGTGLRGIGLFVWRII